MARTCMSCGNRQGPFTRLVVGEVNNTRVNIFTCPIPQRDAIGNRVPDNIRREAALACINRREKRFASA